VPAKKTADLNEIFYRADACWDAGDLAQARKLFAVAARKGHVPSQMNYGVFCDVGFGGKKNAPAAMRWYRTAAKAGDDTAYYALAHVYLKRGNRGRALVWFRRLVDADEGSGSLELAKFYLSGGTAAGLKKAQALLNHAAAADPKTMTEYEIEEVERLLFELKSGKRFPLYLGVKPWSENTE